MLFIASKSTTKLNNQGKCIFNQQDTHLQHIAFHLVTVLFL